MSKVVANEKPYEGWLQIAAAMGCTDRTARRHAKAGKLRIAWDPFGRVYAYREWVQKWAEKWSRTNQAA